MPSLYEHYTQAAMCLIEDGIEEPCLNDVFSEAVTLWKVRYDTTFPDDFQTFFDKYLPDFKEFISSAKKRLYHFDIQAPGYHIDTIVSSSGHLNTRIRKVAITDDKIQVDEHVHNGTALSVTLDPEGGLRVSPIDPS